MLINRAHVGLQLLAGLVLVLLVDAMFMVRVEFG